MTTAASQNVWLCRVTGRPCSSRSKRRGGLGTPRRSAPRILRSASPRSPALAIPGVLGSLGSSPRALPAFSTRACRAHRRAVACRSCMPFSERRHTPPTCVLDEWPCTAPRDGWCVAWHPTGGRSGELVARTDGPPSGQGWPSAASSSGGEHRMCSTERASPRASGPHDPRTGPRAGGSPAALRDHRDATSARSPGASPRGGRDAEARHRRALRTRR